MSHVTLSAGVAFLLYLALTVVLTWPLASGLAREVPGDFGDPLFTSWAIAWDVTHLGRGWWSANIFAPHPLSLAYSEHFLPQALQVWPVYAVTKNPILCYNLLFLSTFALSGLGMFLLGRELTGSSGAGFVAGLAFAFSPYRIASIPHLQVLSSAWMPIVIFGLHRYFATGRLLWLGGAAAAWFTQNLSCGYYLLFFSPVVGFYAGWEITRRGLWRDGRTVARVAAAIAGVLAATAPFLWPYVELRRLGFDARSLDETRRFSADVYAYFTADPNLRVWGSIAQAWPKAEGLLFPGMTIFVLAAIGAAAGLAWAGVETLRHDDRTRRDQNTMPGRPLLLVLLIALSVALTLLLGYSIRLPGLKITSLSRALMVFAIAFAAVVALSRESREASRRWMYSPAGIFSAITLFAVVMSFGPDIHAMGRPVTTANVYAAFYHWVPGFDGVRVPARFAMIVTLGLAALVALGIAAFDSTKRPRVCALAATLVVAEAFAVPIPINQTSTDFKQAALAPLPAWIGIGQDAPPVYRFAAQLPAPAVLIELPLGEPAFDVRYMFYSTLHWRPLVNGYSGGAPEQYGRLIESLKDMFERPDRAWQAMTDSTATHAIVHETAYHADGGVRVEDWLRAYGAREIAVFDHDRVFELRH